uniref:Odorant receptor n=1 Tax=Cacopsylla melanoneura TaxID=428564 RepID=A0A8D8S129_9HEMI
MLLAYYRKLFFGLPPEEVKLVSYYYHKSHPERQLPFMMWLPFDDTVDPMYYVVAAYDGYMMILTLILAVHINIGTLIFAIHIRGQYQILAEYLHQVGNPRLFPYSGNRAPLPRSAQGRQYAVDCVKVIVKRHQYLIDFRNRLQARVKGMLLSKLAVYNVVLTVCLYQLTFITRLDTAAFQLVIQFLCMYSLSYIQTLASEIMEEGNTALRWAAYTNPWYKYIMFKPETKPHTTTEHSTTAKPTELAWTIATAHAQTRNAPPNAAASRAQPQHPVSHIPMLVLLTKQCQIPIRFRFYGSHIDVCYRMFIAVLRFSYSLFALMKQSIQIEK